MPRHRMIRTITLLLTHPVFLEHDTGPVVRGDQIELAKLDLGAGFKHHMIPVSWVDHVDEHVHLNVTKDEAKARWTEKH